MNRMLDKNKIRRMWIDGISFDLEPFDKKAKTHDTAIKIDNNYNFTLKDDGKLCTSFQLPPTYYRKISSFPQFSLKELEKRTETNIQLPILGEIVISGENEANIALARNEIQSIACAIRNQTPPLQFISIPTLSEQVKNNFIKFKTEILDADNKIAGMDESIFQSPDKLHLTLSVFCLLDEREVQAAISSLGKFKETILDPMLENLAQLPKIQVCGIDTMNSDLKRVNVLYANVKFQNDNENFSLQTIANKIADYFYEQGFCKEHKENVKLHMTLINTKYRKSKQNNHKKWNKRIPFDATEIMAKYKEYDFGLCDFDSINLSLMSSVDPSSGFYRSISTIKINKN